MTIIRFSSLQWWGNHQKAMIPKRHNVTILTKRIIQMMSSTNLKIRPIQKKLWTSYSNYQLMRGRLNTVENMQKNEYSDESQFILTISSAGETVPKLKIKAMHKSHGRSTTQLRQRIEKIHCHCNCLYWSGQCIFISPHSSCWSKSLSSQTSCEKKA